MVSRIGIIGDVHAEHEHLAIALDKLTAEGAEVILCTGDIVDGTGDVETCIELLSAHNVQTVRGNHDRWLLENKARHIPNAHQLDMLSTPVVEFLQALPPQRQIPTSSGTLLLCHGVGNNDLQKVWPGTARMPVEQSTQLDQFIANPDLHLMVNGHVHYRTIIHFHGLVLINAGTLRGDHHPGFSLLDLDAHEIQGFEFRPRMSHVKTQSLAPSADTQVFANTQHFDGDWQPTTLYA